MCTLQQIASFIHNTKHKYYNILINMPPKKKKVQKQNSEIMTIPNQLSENKDISYVKDIHKQELTSQKSNTGKNVILSTHPNKQQDKKTLHFYQKCLADATLKLQGKIQDKHTTNQEEPSRKRVFEQLQITSEQGKPQKRIKKEIKYSQNQIVSQIVNEDPKILQERRKKFCTIEQNQGPAIYREPLPIRNEPKMKEFHQKKQQHYKHNQKSLKDHQTFRETKLKHKTSKEIRHKQIRPKETKPQDNHHTKRRNSRQKQSRHKSKHSHRHQSHREVSRHEQAHYKTHSNSRRSHSEHRHRHHRR